MGADFQLFLSDACKQSKKVNPCMQFYFIEKKIKNVSLDFYDLVLKSLHVRRLDGALTDVCKGQFTTTMAYSNLIYE